MRSLKEYKQSQSQEGFFTKLFEARDVAHVMHLKSKSFSEHIALNEFYDGILGFLDQFIETYQGQYGIINSYGTIDLDSGGNPITYLSNFATHLKEAHANLFSEDTNLQNIIDEMTSLTYQTIYKLKNLK